MRTPKFVSITENSTLDTDDRVRRDVNGKYEYYSVKSYDSVRERYILQSFSLYNLSHGVEIVTATQDLLDNFEKEEHE